MLNLKDLLMVGEDANKDANEVVLALNDKIISYDGKEERFSDIYGGICSNASGLVLMEESLEALFFYSGITVQNQLESKKIFVQNNVCYSAVCYFNVLKDKSVYLDFNSLAVYTMLSCDIYLRSVKPVDEDPAIFSIGGFSVQTKDNRSFNFDFNYSKAGYYSNDGHLVIEAALFELDEGCHTEDNYKAGFKHLPLSLFKESSFTEIFYECFKTEADVDPIALEVVQITLSEYDTFEIRTTDSLIVDNPLKELPEE